VRDACTATWKYVAASNDHHKIYSFYEALFKKKFSVAIKRIVGNRFAVFFVLTIKNIL
jgi:hypothetical protein